MRETLTWDVGDNVGILDFPKKHMLGIKLINKIVCYYSFLDSVFPSC